MMHFRDDIKGELQSNYIFLFQLNWPRIGFYNPISKN